MDINRYVPNDVSFNLSSDLSPIVAINSIFVSADPLSTTDSRPNWTNPQTLLDTFDSNLFVIDSSTPFLWLPETACDSFADALRLTYNDTLELYTYGSNSSIRDELISWNLTFTFTIADLPGSSSSVDIILPFAAFDQLLTYPFPGLDANYTSSGMSYFPLRKATSNSQYTIGRTFLQESYLAVDYERNNFSISQATFNADASTNANIVAITRPSNSNFTGPVVDSETDSTESEIGIGVGVAAAAVIAIVLIVLWLRKRSRRGSRDSKGEELTHPKEHLWNKVLGKSATVAPIELIGDKHHPVEAAADMSSSRFELPGEAPVELPGAEAADTFYGADGQRYKRQRDSTEEALARKMASQSPEPPPDRGTSPSLPAYSPVYTCDQNGSRGIVFDTDAISPVSATTSQPHSTSDGSWQRGDRWMPSPLSPYASFDQGQFPSSRSRSSGQISSPSTLQNPRPQTLLSTTSLSPTARTGSRGSRFIEEGLRSTPPPESPSQTRLLEETPDEPRQEPPQEPTLARKFSWEE